jgi:hypothetical protein
MPNSSAWLHHAARPLVASLIPVMFCTAASAQSYSHGPSLSENHFMGVPGYGSRPPTSEQRGPFLSGVGAGAGFGAGPGWTSWQQSRAAFAGNPATPSYDSRQTWANWQRAPRQAAPGVGVGFGANSGWPSWQPRSPFAGDPAAPSDSSRQTWPNWAQAPVQTGTGTAIAIGGGGRALPAWQQGSAQPGSGASYKGSDGAPSSQPPQPQPVPSGGRSGVAGDGGHPIWHPKPVFHVHVPAVPRAVPTPPSSVPVVASPSGPPPAITLPVAPQASDPTPAPSEPVLTPPIAHEPPPIGRSGKTGTAAPPASPPSLPVNSDAAGTTSSKSVTNHQPQPQSPVLPLAQIVSQASTVLGAVAALALVVPLLRLLAKPLRRRWRHDRPPMRARVALVSDQARSSMIVADAATADPAIELRLVTAPPVSTLRLAA